MKDKLFWGLLLAAEVQLLISAVVLAAPEVRNVTAVHCWPWTNVVSICYEVAGTIPTNAPPLFVTATDREENATYVSSPEALSGETGGESGMHQVIWNLDKQGLNLQSTNVTFTVAYEWPLYCVVDLSGGWNTSSYPVTYLNEQPKLESDNYRKYRGDRLLLRRIDPGTFMMGGRYQTTLTKTYYIGVFEVTQRQYQLVTTTEYWGDYRDTCRPVGGHYVSWQTIRGETNWPASSAVSADSFMGRLQTRTGLPFDLPTEAQWEYACRAGTTNYYNNGGGTTNDLNTLGRYYNNQTDGKGGYTKAHTTVGAYLPNAWGLYDMHGNVQEWCLDWYGNLTNGVTDPMGAATGTERVARGGSWRDSAWDCRSESRQSPNTYSETFGFRVACPVER